MAAWLQSRVGSWVSGKRVGCGNHSLLILHSTGAIVRKVFSYRASVCVHVCTCVYELRTMSVADLVVAQGL